MDQTLHEDLLVRLCECIKDTERIEYEINFMDYCLNAFRGI
jgi:hypothetical protein